MRYLLIILIGVFVTANADNVDHVRSNGNGSTTYHQSPICNVKFIPVVDKIKVSNTYYQNHIKKTRDDGNPIQYVDMKMKVGLTSTSGFYCIAYGLDEELKKWQCIKERDTILGDQIAHEKKLDKKIHKLVKRKALGVSKTYFQFIKKNTNISLKIPLRSKYVKDDKIYIGLIMIGTEDSNDCNRENIFTGNILPFNIETQLSGSFTHDNFNFQQNYNVYVSNPEKFPFRIYDRFNPSSHKNYTGNEVSHSINLTYKDNKVGYCVEAQLNDKIHTSDKDSYCKTLRLYTSDLSKEPSGKYALIQLASAKVSESKHMSNVIGNSMYSKLQKVSKTDKFRKHQFGTGTTFYYVCEEKNDVRSIIRELKKIGIDASLSEQSEAFIDKKCNNRF